MLTVRVLVVVLSIGLAWTSRALNSKTSISQYQQDVWTERDGLPPGSVQAITQTRDGYLWVGTRDGLARFDGVKFVVFRAETTAELRSNDIRALAEDQSGNLWIGTFNGGLCRYFHGQFNSYSFSSGIQDSGIFEIVEDRRKNLWANTSGGLALVQGPLENFEARADGLRDRAGWSLFRDKSGEVWTVGALGCYRFSGEAFVPVTEPFDVSKLPIRRACSDREGTVWLATKDALWSLDQGRLQSYPREPGLSDSEIRVMTHDHDGNLWLGTWNGLWRFHGGRFSSYTRKDGLPHDHVEALCEDREGSLWIGTRGGGLARLHDGKFANFTTQEGLAHDFAKCIFQDRGGILWVGSHGGGLSRYSGGRFATVADAGLASQFIWAIEEDRAGRLWVGAAHPAGLSVLENGRFTTYGPADGFRIEGGVRVIFADRQGNLWLGGDGGGLGRLREATFSYFTTRDGLPADLVRSIQQDRAGHLWIGTTEGLARFHEGHFVNFTTVHGLAHNLVYAIHEDADGILWFGTQGGLTRYAEGQFRSYTPRDGLFSAVVYQILEDGNQNLWMSGNRGVFRVAKHDLSEFDAGRARSVACASYGTADGMKAAQCEGASQPAGCRTRDGRLWFPTANGVAVIDPADFPGNSQPPPVLIEQVVADDRNIVGQAVAALSADTREVQFRYTALSFLAPDKIRYKYRLNGREKNWVEAETRRTASYRELPPGRYQFQVAACNADGIWNETGASFAFTIAPHFHQTVWFYAICGVAASLVAWSFHRFRLQQTRDEFALVLGERNRIARDLHDTLAQGFAGIAFQLEAVAAKLKEAPAQAQQHLDVALNMVRHSLSEARRSVMNLRSAALEKGDILNALDETARETIGGKMVAVDLELIGAAAPLSPTVEENLLRVGQEAITNALKHSGGTRIQIRLSYSPRSVCLSIRDNGKGFEPSIPSRGNGAHFGLLGMRERAKQVDGALRIRSDGSFGTEITFEAPITTNPTP